MTFSFETVLWCLLIVATVTDLLTGKIYNLLTLPALLLGILFQFISSGINNLSTVLLSIAAAFLIFFPLYLIKTMAAGDVKLIMALGAWSNASSVLRIGLLSVCIGALVGLVIMLRKKGFISSAKGIAGTFKISSEEKTRIPFAPAFLCAFMVLKIMEQKGWQLF